MASSGRAGQVALNETRWVNSGAMGNVINKLVLVAAILLGLLSTGSPYAIAQSQSGPAWENLSGRVILGTPGGEDMLLALECYRKGELVMIIPTSNDGSSGDIYFTNPDVKTDPYKLEGEFFPEDKELNNPPYFDATIGSPGTFLSYFEGGAAVQVSGVVTMTLPVDGGAEAIIKLLAEEPCAGEPGGGAGDMETE
jgi:hypothetical protein